MLQRAPNSAAADAPDWPADTHTRPGAGAPSGAGMDAHACASAEPGGATGLLALPIEARLGAIAARADAAAERLDFGAPGEDARVARERKTLALCELIEAVRGAECADEATKAALTDAALRVFAANALRDAPPPRRNPVGPAFCAEDDEPVFAPDWPHRSLAYALAIRAVESPAADAAVARGHLTPGWVRLLLRVFDSEDSRERDMAKTLLHRVYGKFLGVRAAVRRAMRDVFHAFLAEDGEGACVASVASSRTAISGLHSAREGVVLDYPTVRLSGDRAIVTGHMAEVCMASASSSALVSQPGVYPPGNFFRDSEYCGADTPIGAMGPCAASAVPLDSSAQQCADATRLRVFRQIQTPAVPPPVRTGRATHPDERVQHNIGELLEVLASIVNGFALPLREEHRSTLVRTLLPLHRSRHLAAFHAQLALCVVQFVEKDAGLLEPVVRLGLLRFWPRTASAKEVLFLSELEDVLEAGGHDAFARVAARVAARLGRCLASAHFQVAERALSLWANPRVVALFAGRAAETFPALLPPMLRLSRALDAPSPAVQLQVLAGLRALMDAAPGPYEAVSSAEDAALDDSPPANQMRWKGVEDAAARSAFGPGVSSGRTSLDAGARM